MKLQFPLSYSSMTTYEDCPRRFHQRYVLKIPSKPKSFFSFGQSLHSVLEFFYGGPKPPTVEAMLIAYDHAWNRQGYRDTAQEAEYYDHGKDILRRFHEKHSPDYKQPLDVEVKFTVKLGGVPLTGKIDRVDRCRGGVSILDYKTGKPLDPERIKEDAQLTTYQAATEIATGKKVRELILYHLPTLTPSSAIRRTEAQVAKVVKRLRAVARGIEDDEFAETPSDETCRWCDYREGCPAMKAGAGSKF
jgi:DNA helicase-2/ATP-dependent DNA helicase PcrA